MTDEEKFYADLGELFVAARVNRNMSIDAISRMTKIDPARYRAIERGAPHTAHEFVRIWLALS